MNGHSQDNLEELREEIRKALRKAEWGSRLWSVAHHGSGILSILASAVAAFLVASKKELVDDQSLAIAALSGLAASLTAISTFAGFSRKWEVNRSTRSALRILKLGLKTEDPAQLREQFRAIMEAHERGIVGGRTG